MLLVAFFVTLVHRTLCFCTDYSPLDGSRFAFPARRCLTPEFMEEQFQNGRFGKERINLASSVRNLTYNGVSMALALEASLGWESGHTVTAIFDIILREILGINTEFVCTWGSVHAMKMLGGCQNPMDPSASCIVDGVPQLAVPLAHVSVESWVTTPAEVNEMNTYNTNLGMIGYYSKSGLHMDKEIADEAFRNDRVSLEWWQSFVDLPNVADYFDNYAVVTEDIGRTLPGANVYPGCKVGDSGYTELIGLGYACTDGWFFSPACEADKFSCIPVVLAEYDWNGLVWIQAVIQHGYRFAVTWLGSQNWLLFSTRTQKRLMFYCATTSALCYEKPIVKMFADNKMPVGRPDLITSLLKVVWKQLPNIDERIVDFLSNMNLPSEDLQALMHLYSEKKAWLDVDKFVPEIACDWLTNKLDVVDVAGSSTGANAAKWARWIPRMCTAGYAYDKAMGQCRPCKAGEYSLDGWKCAPCSPGTFTDRPALAACSLCEEGTWQSSMGGTMCESCPVGWQRRSSDYGCQMCRPGHYAETSGQPQCLPCDQGAWASAAGASECSSCQSAFTTANQASTSSQDCIFDPIVGFTVGAIIFVVLAAFVSVVLSWRWRRHRTQMQEAGKREQMYFRGTAAVMRTMCSSGVMLRITPQGYIKAADPKDGLEGLKEGVRIQECIAESSDLNRFGRHIEEVILQYETESLALGIPFNFSIRSSTHGSMLQLKSCSVAFTKDEILMGIQIDKGDFVNQPGLPPSSTVIPSFPSEHSSEKEENEKEDAFDQFQPGFVGEDAMDDVASMATFKTTTSVIDGCSPFGGGNWKMMPVTPLGLGNYTSIRVIGRGTFGTVQLVADEVGQQFALKRIHLPGKIWERDFPARLKAADREARLLKSLDWASEVVVQYRDCWLQNNAMSGPCACIVMEWLPKTLRGVLNECDEAAEGRVRISDACFWFVCMTCALGAIHSMGWLHRDIKTDNILLTEDGKTCKVADFGLGRPMHKDLEREVCARTHEDLASDVVSTVGSIGGQSMASALTGYTEMQGTLLYMSPEGRAAGGHYGPPADIFALGCVLLEMLVGKRKFAAAVSTAVSESLAADLLEANEQSHYAADDDNATRTDLAKLCLQLLADDAQKRPTVTAILSRDLLGKFVGEMLQRAPSLRRVLGQNKDATAA